MDALLKVEMYYPDVINSKPVIVIAEGLVKLDRGSIQMDFVRGHIRVERGERVLTITKIKDSMIEHLKEIIGHG